MSNTNINIMNNGPNRKGLEKTGRIGSVAGANQNTLTEKDIMLPKIRSAPGSLSMKISLD